MPWGECSRCNHDEIDVMGLSVREERWRYTEWLHWEKKKQAPAWRRPLVGLELYDHQGDLGADFDAAAPTKNLADATEWAHVRTRLSKVLRDHFMHDLLPPQIVEGETAVVGE